MTSATSLPLQVQNLLIAGTALPDLATREQELRAGIARHHAERAPEEGQERNAAQPGRTG